MRILAASSGGEGHLGPLLPFLDAARTAGDEVLVVVPPEQEATLRAHGHEYELSPGVDPAAAAAVRDAMASSDRAERSRLAEVELFGRLCTEAALPTVERAAAAFGPDLVLREPCDYASAIVAHRRGVPTAQVAISPDRADLGGLHLAAQVVEPVQPGVVAAVERAPYLSRFPRLDSGFADSRGYGFAVAPFTRDPGSTPLVWLTFGTVNASFTAFEGTWRAVLDAVADLPVRAVASVGRTDLRLDAPANVEVVGWVELPDILARASLVVCHGGSGTTLAALSAGIPLVVVPLLADQPTNAAMVEDLHAGIAVRTDTEGALRGLVPTDVGRVRAAIAAVLADRAYERGARRVAQGLALRPSVPDRLDELRRGS